jgi:hypothetical protein
VEEKITVERLEGLKVEKLKPVNLQTCYLQTEKKNL